MANVRVVSPFTDEDLRFLSDAIEKGPTVYDRFQALFDCAAEANIPTQVVEPGVFEFRCPSQTATVTLHQPGNIVEMADGRKYEVQDNGQWKRIS